MFVIFPLVGAIGPLFLWLFQKLVPFPLFFEELFKLLLVLAIAKSAPSSQKLIYVLLSGLLFSLSETTLYLTNIALTGNLVILLTRLFATAFLHTATMLLYLLVQKRGKAGLAIGFTLGVSLHVLYNTWVWTLGI